MAATITTPRDKLLNSLVLLRVSCVQIYSPLQLQPLFNPEYIKERLKRLH